jgi:hypothetical protein
VPCADVLARADGTPLADDVPFATAEARREAPTPAGPAPGAEPAGAGATEAALDAPAGAAPVGGALLGCADPAATALTAARGATAVAADAALATAVLPANISPPLGALSERAPGPSGLSADSDRTPAAAGLSAARVGPTVSVAP